MTDILQLPGWEATGTRTEQGEFIIEAKYTVPATSCIKCGVVGALYRHGTKKVRLRDSPVRGLPAVLDGTVQRYKCRDCGETFLPAMQGIETARRMTERCVQYIQEQCTRDTFTRIAEHVGCVEGTVRNLAAERTRPKAEPVLMAAEPVAEYESPRLHLIREKGNRCDSCGGIYDDIDLRVTRTGIRNDGEPLSGVSLLCGHCYVRFHTDGHLGNGSLST